MNTTVHVQPLAVNKATAAHMLGGLSVSTFEALVRTEPMLAPVQISAHRVAWPVDNLRAWLATRPPSDILPPKNCQHGRKPIQKEINHGAV